MPLSIGRSKGQSVDIGTDIVVTVTWVKGGQCRLEIDAPKNVKIKRSELEAIAEGSARATEGRSYAQEYA